MSGVPVAVADLSHEAVARRAVAMLRGTTIGSTTLASSCKVAPAFIDAALAPLVDAGKLMRINAFRHGGAEFDYRWSATWVPQDSDYALCKGGGTAPSPGISPVAPPAPGKLEKAAAPAALPAHVTRPVLREDHVQNGKSGGHSKAAKASLDRAFAQSPQSLGWAPAPGPIHHEEKTVSTNTRRPHPTRAATAQFQICALLMSKGDLSRGELCEAVTADVRAFQSATYNAKRLGRITVIEKTGKFRLTAQGKEWTRGGANAATKAAEVSPRAVKRRRVKLAPDERRALSTAVAVAVPGPIQVVQERSFRCAVFSDGGFHLSKNGTSIDLDAVEHAQMLRYLERMEEEQPGSPS